MKYSAVIFDLFGTLIERVPQQERRRVLLEMASVLSIPFDEFVRLWFDTGNERFTGIIPSIEANLEYICKKFKVPSETDYIRLAAGIRVRSMARSIKPREDAVETLIQLRTSGHRIGLVSNCSPEVPTCRSLM